MAPLTLNILSSIIYPTTSNTFSPDAVKIDITPPSSSSSSPAAILTGPSHPIYRLPQSLSSGGLKVHLNVFTRSRASPTAQAEIEINRHSHTSIIDKDHILYEICKVPVGSEYSLTCFRHGKSSGGYGEGRMAFTSGWFSGGVWDVHYVYKSPGAAQEQRVELKVDEGGKENGVWRMVYPLERVVARENPQPQGEFRENGKSIELEEDGGKGIAGLSSEEWRDFLAACWCAKVWRESTRTPWMGASAREVEREAGGLGRW